MSTLQTQINKWLVYIESVVKLSDRTVMSYTSDIKLFSDYCHKNNIESAKNITIQTIHGFIESMSDSNANSTINRRKSCLKNFFNYLITTNEVSDNIPSLIKPRKLKKTTPKSLTISESRLLIECAKNRNVRDGLIVEMLLLTGLRSFELANIQNSDIKNKTLLVTSGKGDKQREIPLSDYLLSRISEYSDYKIQEGILNVNNDYLFINRRNNKITEKNIQVVMKSVLTEIGRGDLSCHKTRSTFASLLNKNGVSVATIQSLCGHSNIQTTMRYISVDEDTKRSAILMNPLQY